MQSLIGRTKLKLSKLYANFWPALLEELRALPQRLKAYYFEGGRTEAQRRERTLAEEAERQEYWREALEDYADELAPTEGSNVGEVVGSHILFALFAAIGLLLPLAYVNVIIFAYPGGFPRVIGQFLAQTCIATGNCDFGYLMAGLAFALQFLFVIFALIVIGLIRASRSESASPRQTVGDAFDHAYLDNRLVRLHEELEEAGVLRAEEDEWEAE